MHDGTILITGGAGFVGANLAIWLKQRHPTRQIIALDNLKRRGSELNLPRLRTHGIEFVHGDIRNPEDLAFPGTDIRWIIECSAEPSVLAGYGESPEYLVHTNLLGTFNCLELARRRGAAFIFLSTSRVYPIEQLNRIETNEGETRFVIAAQQAIAGASVRGISEAFPLAGPRSLYGATKLCSELIVQEYGAMYGLRYVINRCGVLTGPWQMGKVDQGVFALWMATHYFGGELTYIGWHGSGKQVRDLLHIADLAALIAIEIEGVDQFSGEVFNVGGGADVSLSLLETTRLCQEITGRVIPIRPVTTNRPADVKVYVSDTTHVTAATGWRPQQSARGTLAAIFAWLQDAEGTVRHLWGGG